MRTEFTRQTRWERDPEAVDPARMPAGSPYVREWIWVPCTTCDLQVHAARARSITEGVTCPECEKRLVEPSATSGPAADKIHEEECRMTEELRR